MQESWAYRAAFDFHNRHAPCPDSVEAWQKAAQDAQETAVKGNNDPFLRDLLTAVYAQMERVYKVKNNPADGLDTQTRMC